MSYETVLPIWHSIQSRFYKMAEKLPTEDLTLKQGPASIGYMLQHNAEVEYMFADWFFGTPIPPGVPMATSSGPAGSSADFTDLEPLLRLLIESNEHLRKAMRNLPEEAWNQPVESPMGLSTPLEAIGRLMYHTGIHAGQISLIQKLSKAPAKNSH